MDPPLQVVPPIPEQSVPMVPEQVVAQHARNIHSATVKQLPCKPTLSKISTEKSQPTANQSKTFLTLER